MQFQATKVDNTQIHMKRITRTQTGIRAIKLTLSIQTYF